MTERSYITVDRAEDPRIIEVAAPGSGGSDEVTIQDLHDTLNSNTLPAGDPDDSLDNMDDDFMLDSGGKEELGGGVLVGITSTLNNAQVAFEGNYSPAQTGTATSANGAGRQLTDTAATFVTNGVQRGAVILNWTDKSVAEVTKVVSETVIEHRVLQGGTGNDWSVNDDYSIFNVIQKEISGGNLVSVDNDQPFPEGTSISPVFPTFATQVVRTASSSATLQEQQDIQYASFGGGVTVDLTSPYSGTAFPNGTPRQPVNNIADAVLIANERGFTQFFIIGNLILNSGTPPLTGFVFVGESQNKTTITIDPAAQVDNAEFLTSTITGTLDGGNVLNNCVIQSLNFVDGFVEQCVLEGTVTLSGAADAHFLDCWSGVPGGSTPVIDFGGSGSSLAMRNWSGGIRLQNKSGSGDVASLDLVSGQVVVDDTVTAGTLTLRGVGKWTNKDTYAGGATINDELLSSQNFIDQLDDSDYDGKTFRELQIILLAMAQGRIRETSAGSKIFEVYAQDNTTILYTLTKTALERTRS